MMTILAERPEYLRATHLPRQICSFWLWRSDRNCEQVS